MMHRFATLLAFAVALPIAACGGKVDLTSSSKVVGDPSPQRPPKSKLAPPGSEGDDDAKSAGPTPNVNECGPVVEVTDCDTRAGYSVSSYRAPAPGKPEVHVIGVYETRAGSGRGSGNVQIARRGHHVLVLTAYQSVDWRVTARRDAVIDRIILEGYGAHTVKVDADVPVDDWSGKVTNSAYDWDHAGTKNVVALVEKEVGAPLSSFGGCYRATSFVVRDDAATCPDD